MRAAVLTASPATIPCPSAAIAPRVTATCPVLDADPHLQRLDAELLAEHPCGRDEIEPGSDRSLGIVLASRGHPPDSEDRVADELLYGAVVALDDRPRSLEIGRQQVAHRLGVAGLGDRCEADHVGEQQRRRPPLRDRFGREAIALTPCAAGEAPLSRPGIGVPHSLQNRPPPSDAPQTAQACDIGTPHSLQNFAPARFAAPHLLQAVSDPAPGTSASFERRRDTSGRQPGPLIGTRKGYGPRTPKTA